MDAAVIELDALADAVGAAAEDHDFAFGAGHGLVVAAIVGGIIVRRVGLEFGGAGVHQTVAGHQPELPAQGADGVLGLAGEMGDLAVGETEGFGFGQEVAVHQFAKMSRPVSGGGERNSRIKRAMYDGRIMEDGGRRLRHSTQGSESHSVFLEHQPIGVGERFHRRFFRNHSKITAESTDSSWVASHCSCRATKPGEGVRSCARINPRTHRPAPAFPASFCKALFSARSSRIVSISVIHG